MAEAGSGSEHPAASRRLRQPCSSVLTNHPSNKPPPHHPPPPGTGTGRTAKNKHNSTASQPPLTCNSNICAGLPPRPAAHLHLGGLQRRQGGHALRAAQRRRQPGACVQLVPADGDRRVGWGGVGGPAAGVSCQECRRLCPVEPLWLHRRAFCVPPALSTGTSNNHLHRGGPRKAERTARPRPRSCPCGSQSRPRQTR